jgi:exosortase
MDSIGKITENPETLSKGRYFILWGILGISFILCYLPTFIWLNQKFSGLDSYYSHGYLIPFVTAYLIYLKRNELKAIKPSSSAAGLWLIIAALVIHVFGEIAVINFVSSFSMVLYIAGASLYLMGREFSGKIAFPILFLIFMCPIPDGFINWVALPMKSLSTSLALKLVDLGGIPYIREGFRIHFAASTFIVGTPCNGIRSLISFFALGFLFLYFIKPAWWKSIIFLLIIPIISISLNGLRIAILLFIADRYGQEAASPESYLHDGSGILVFIIGIALLLLVSRKIENAEKNG